MPKIDLQTLPTVAQAESPAPQLHLDSRGAFGEGLGEATKDVGLQGFRIALEAKAQADTSAVEDAETKLQQHITDTLYGSPDKPDSGFLKQRGDNAVASSADTMASIATKRQEIMDQALTNGAQKEAFRRRTDGYLLHSQRAIESHTAQQVDVSHAQSFQAKEASSLDAISRGFSDPATRQVEIQRFEGYAMAEAKRLGLAGATQYPPPDDSPAGHLIAEWRQKAIGTVLQRYIDNRDTAGAQAFLAQPLHSGVAPVPLPPEEQKALDPNAPAAAPGEPATRAPTVRELLGAKAGHYEAELRRAGDQADAYDSADKIVQQFTPKVPSPTTPGAFEPGPVNEDAARAAIAQLPKQQRPEARQQLEVQLGHAREQRKQLVEERRNVAQEAYNAGGLRAIPGGLSSWVKEHDAHFWRALTKEAETDSREKAEREPKPTEAQEDQAAKVAIDMIDNPQKYANLSPTDFRSGGEPTDAGPGGTYGLTRAQRSGLLGHLVTTHGKARDPKESVPPQAAQAFLVKARGAHLLPMKGRPTEGERAKYFQAGLEYIRQQQNAKIATGAKPSDADYQRWVGDAVAPVFVESTGFFGGKSQEQVPRAKALGDEQDFEEAPPPPEKIPPAVEKQIRADLAARNIPAGDEHVRYIFDLSRGRKVAKPSSFRPLQVAEPQPVDLSNQD